MIRFCAGISVWFQFVCVVVAGTVLICEAEEPVTPRTIVGDDFVRVLQQRAIEKNKASFGYWGTDPDVYTGWKSHSNRLIPVYTFGTKNAGPGVDLSDYTGVNSPYRANRTVRRIYGFIPERTVNSSATWMDQTNVADIQRAAIAAGRKYVFLVVFDGMDWQTTHAAATFNQSRVAYLDGRGTGTHFQDYDADGTSQFAWMVTSPHNEGTIRDATTQVVENPGGKVRGGYDAAAGGTTPWDSNVDRGYLIGKPADSCVLHAYTDSASAATAMTTGVKTYNGAVNVDSAGEKLTTIAHEVQEQGFSVGAVSSVPVSHATPAAAYAHNVSRNDYQDLIRDMLGLASVQHPQTPLPGLDVLIGGGYGVPTKESTSQGDNFVPGNTYLTKDDLAAVDVNNGGRYVTAVRTSGSDGCEILMQAAKNATANHHRLFGFFGLSSYRGHLPFATADGHFNPAPGIDNKSETYTEADLAENPTIADMTNAAIRVLSRNPKGFWLMVEPGDVDWANHDDNLDNSIGAVRSGDLAVKVITDWVEDNSNWQESLLIVTADHGHMFNLTRPEALVGE
jgi:alkaline phosphatase